jgi:hypothetical protein
MSPTTSRPRLLVLAAVGCLAVGLCTQLPALAAPGPGTWTKITTPKSRIHLLSRDGNQGQLKIAGKASSDVTAVNVYCVLGRFEDTFARTVATSVPVSTGAFSTSAPIPAGKGNPPTCRLRALPSGVSPSSAYVASYAGPIVDLNVWDYVGAPSTTTDFQVEAGHGTGDARADSFNQCAVPEMRTAQPDLRVLGGSYGCFAYVGTDAAGTHMQITVDGHPVYATWDQKKFSVPGAQPTRVSVSQSKGGIVTWRQTDQLLRCASDTFPPTSGSCDTSKPSGVSLRRVGTYGAADGHQVQLDDAFISTDGKKHKVRVSYQSAYAVPPSGEAGLRIPGHGSSFTTLPAGATVGGLPKGAATLLVRSNKYADEGDQRASTLALTWSRSVAGVDVDSSDGTVFGIPFTGAVKVPKNGIGHLRLVLSQSVLTSQARALATAAERAMVAAPRVTSPAGGVVKGRSTTVKGVVKAGANGLPTSVTVNGHAAKLKPNKSGSKATYSVTFTESLGKHTLTVVAEDLSGNTRTTKVAVRNT